MTGHSIERYAGTTATRARFRSSELLVAGSALALGGSVVVGMGWAITPLITVAVAGVLMTAVLVPFVGLATLAFLAPMKEAAIVPAPGFDFALVGAILLGCIFRLPIDRPRIALTPGLAFPAAFVAFVGAQQLPQMIAGYPGAEDHAGYLFFTFAACLGAIVVALHLLNNRSPYPLLAMAVAGSAFAAIVSLSPLVVSGTPFANLTAEPTLESVRGSGPFINPNYLGMFASTTLVATLGLWPILRSSRARFGLIATVLLLGGTVALSESRGAIVALLIGLCCLMYAKRRFLTIFVMVAGIVLTPVLYPMFQQWRLENLRGEASSAGYVAWAASDENRLAGAEVGPTLFLSSPIFGIGVGQYAPLSVQIAGRRTPIESHDWYINVLAEQGVVGMALWAAFSIAVVAKLRRVSRPSVRTLGGSVLATIAVSGLFTAPPTSFQEITIPAIVLAAVLVADWGEKPEADRSPEHMASRGAVLSTGANA